MCFVTVQFFHRFSQTGNESHHNFTLKTFGTGFFHVGANEVSPQKNETEHKEIEKKN